MGFFKRLANLLGAGGQTEEDRAYWVTSRCHRCGEIVRARVDLRNDLSANYGEDGSGETTYFCRKLLVGEQGCFQQMEVELTFDQNRKLIDRSIRGGEFVDEEKAS